MPFNVWDSAALTETIRRSIETQLERAQPLGPQIAPLVSVKDRRIKRRGVEIEAFGKGQFKARNATPPLYTPRIRWDEQVIELALLEEMTEIEEDEWHNLTSPDEHIRNRAGVDIITRTRVLQLRNERLTEWMRFQAFKDELEVEYSDGNPNNKYGLVYGIPSAHKPDVSITDPWSIRTASNPIDNLRAWQKLVGRAVGVRALNVHLNSDTYEDLERSDQVKAMLTPTGRSLLLPEQTDVTRLLYEGSKIIVHDGAFREENAVVGRGYDDHTLYIPDGYVLMTTPYEIDGENIADVPDGRVAVATGYNSLEWRQGMQSETMANTESKTYFIRQASARIPRIHRPEAFIWAKVSP